MHTFREAAVEAVKDEFERRGLKNIEDRKTFIAAILGSADDQISAERPFLWMSTNDEDWKGATLEYERKVRI
jgi:hypothetical protein